MSMSVQKSRKGNVHDGKESVGLIQRRLREVRSMVRSRTDLETFFENVNGDQKKKLLNIDQKEIQKAKRERKKWKAIRRFRFAVNFCRLLIKATLQRRKYVNDILEEIPEIFMATNPNWEKSTAAKDHRIAAPFVRPSLSSEILMSITMAPEFKSPTHIKWVSWLLTATKAFIHLFPAEMSRELAMAVGYERYDDDRVIAYQGKPPEKFYYVLSGRIHLLREYKLALGSVTKSKGFLDKGMTTDAEELERKWSRENHLIAKGHVEVIVIHRQDFLRLQHTTCGPPVDFLRSISLFKEFPCEKVLSNPEAALCRYYGPGRLIARDAPRTPWLYIVKSGFVKVLRSQRGASARNEFRFMSKKLGNYGCGQTFRHASTMLALPSVQRKMNTSSYFNLQNITQKPKINQTTEEEQIHFANSMSPDELPFCTSERNSNTEETAGITKHLAQRTDIREKDDQRMHEPKSRNLPDIKSFSASFPQRRSRRISVQSLLMNKTPKASGEAVGPLTRRGMVPTQKKSNLQEGPRGWKASSRRKALRNTYLQLDLLKPRDIFGLEDLAERERHQEPDGVAWNETCFRERDEGKSVISLVSDGAEVLKISKRFFLIYAGSNTMLRVETVREYMSPETTECLLHTQETWNQYKAGLMRALISNLPAIRKNTCH